MPLCRACTTLTLVLAVSTLAAGVAPAAAAESLTQALGAAYRGNPTLEGARARLRATNEQVPQALSNWRPEVSVNASAGRQAIEDEDQFTTTEETTTPRSASLRVQQPVYRGGRTGADTERAELTVKRERKRLVTAQQDVLQRAVEAYMDVWRERAVLRLNKENVRALEDQLAAAKARFNRGVATRTDVAQARTRLARARSRREDTQGRLTEARATYEEIIGHRPDELRYPGNLVEIPGSVEAAVSRAAANNPQVLAAQFASQAAERAVRERTGALLPTLTLTGEVSRREASLTPADERESAEVRLDLQVPLYQSGRVTSQIREAKQTASQRRVQVAEAKRQARREARSAWGALTAARNQLDQRETQVESAKIAVKGAEEELDVGSRSVLDVLDAEQDLFNAQIGRVRARRDLAVARFRVLAAVGGLTARGLNLEVPLYDPTAAYEDVRGSWWSLDAPGAAPDDTDSDRDTDSGRDTDTDTGADTDTDGDPEAGPTKARAADTDSDAAASASERKGDAAEADRAAAREDESAAAREDAEGEASAPAAAGEFGRAELREVEQLLAELDFQTGEVDGRMDPETRAAIGRFQSMAGLPVTHKADAELLDELRTVANQAE